MSQSSENHLDDETLTRWIDFEYGAGKLDQINAHLEQCVECADQLERLLLEHPFTVAPSLPQVLRETRQIPNPDDTSNDLRYETSLVAPPQSMPLSKKSVLGMGGTGKVWRAFDPNFGRYVAIKELRPEISGSSQAQKRLLREAKIAGQLGHPGIVPVFNLLGEDNSISYSMRLLDGDLFASEIHQYHESESADRFSDFLRLLSHFISVCNTVAYAHSLDVVHRDLKSDNVVIGEFGEVVVVDWGLAKYVSDPIDSEEDEDLSEFETDSLQDENFSIRVTLRGQRLGTPAFMAPEQALGNTDEINKHTDVFCLAGILYEILCGHTPYSGVSAEATMQRACIGRPVPPSERASNVPRELEDICLAGMKADWRQRTITAKEMAERVEQWVVSQAEQKRSEVARQRFFDLSMDMMAVLDVQGRVIEMNKAFTSILGWEKEDLPGKWQKDLIYPAHRKLAMHAIRSAFEGDARGGIEVLFKKKDGEFLWTLWNVGLIREQGYTYVMGRDISNRKRMELRYRRLFDSAPDAMIVVDGDANIRLINLQGNTMFGYDVEELVGQPVTTLIPERFRVAHDRYFRAYVESPGERPLGEKRELNGLCKDGREFRIQISLSPIETEPEVLLACTIRELSKTGKSI